MAVELFAGMMCRIRQRESNTHTILTILPGGKPFPAENFLLAQAWHKNGLLDSESRGIVEQIIAKHA